MTYKFPPLNSSNIEDSTATGRSLIKATSSAAARKALGPLVFDARDYGVIADDAVHNNVANLLDCFAQARLATVSTSNNRVWGAGPGIILLPQGVIRTSEATYGTTVTADSGRQYFNHGGIPIFSNITVMGHGVKQTKIRLSKGFTRLFDFASDGTYDQIFENITIKDMTVSREFLAGTDVAPPAKCAQSVSRTTWGWFTVPLQAPATGSQFVNCDSVFISNDNGTTGYYAPARVSNGELQLLNGAGMTLTVVYGATIQGTLQSHVLLGNVYKGTLGPTPAYGDNYTQALGQSFNNITVENVEIANIATSPPRNWGPKYANNASGIHFGSQPWVQEGIGGQSSPTVTNCRFEKVTTFGGNTGIAMGINGEGWVDNIQFIDCYHDTLVPPNPLWAGVGGNFMVIANKVGSVYMERCVGKNSFDVAIEIDNAWNFTCKDSVFENAWNGVYIFNYTAPTQTQTGPPATTLVTGIDASATTATLASLPTGVARQGLATIAPLPWTVNWNANTAYTEGTVVKIRGVNRFYVCVTAGTSAASGSGPVGNGSAITDGTVVWAYTDTEFVWYRATSSATANVPVELVRGINGTVASAHTANGIGLTFVEYDKPQYTFERVTVNQKEILASGPGASGPAFLFYGGRGGLLYPLPNITMRDCRANLLGGWLYGSSDQPGGFVSWNGWLPSLTMDNCAFRHEGVVQPGTKTGGGIGWKSDKTAAHAVANLPIPPTRISGRGNTMRVSGTATSGAPIFKALRAGSGHVRLDLDLSVEVNLTGAGGVRLVDFDNGNSTSPIVIAPSSRLRIVPVNTGAMSRESKPIALSVGPTNQTIISDHLDVEMSALDVENTGLQLDSSQTGKVWLSYNATAGTHSAPEKLVPVDEDEFAVADSQDSFSLKKLPLATLKSVMATTPGPPGSTGPAGPRGSYWWRGTGAPGTITGAVNNDLYLDSNSGNVYQLLSGTWTLVQNIVGPQGPSGPAGAIGQIDGGNAASPGPISLDGGNATSSD